MPDPAAVERFIDEYRRTFQAFDADAIAALFAFPVQVVSDADGVTVSSVPTIEGWRPQIERITGAYRLLGITAATVAELRVSAVTPHVAQVVVRWSLARADGSPVYDFTASYTLVDLGEDLRITSIAHDETPKLLAAVAAARGA